MQVPVFLQTVKLHVPCQWIGMHQHGQATDVQQSEEKFRVELGDSGGGDGDDD